MTAKTFSEFELYSLDPSGVGVVVKANNTSTATEHVIYPGQSLIISEPSHALNVDKNGVSWLDYTDAEQVRIYGSVR